MGDKTRFLWKDKFGFNVYGEIWRGFDHRLRSYEFERKLKYKLETVPTRHRSEIDGVIFVFSGRCKENVIICSDNKCISEKELEAILDSFSFLKDKPKIFYFGTSEKINKKIRRKDIGHHTFIHNATIKELGTSWNEKGCPLIAAMHSIYLKNYEKHKNEEISWKESGLQINEYLKNKTVQIAENEEKNECDLNVYIVPKQKKKKKKKRKMINDDMMKQPLHKKRKLDQKEIENKNKNKNKMNEEAIKKMEEIIKWKIE